MQVVLDDIGADAAKTGMLHRADVIAAVAEVLRSRARPAPLVVDPVMFAKGGAALLEDSALGPLVETLLPLARLATPNRPEAERLAGMEIAGEADMRLAGQRILALGPRAVLVKGGHLEGAELVDVLVEPGGASRRFAGSRLESRNTHGTGCTLASAIAVSLAQGCDLAAAVARGARLCQTGHRLGAGFRRWTRASRPRPSPRRGRGVTPQARRSAGASSSGCSSRSTISWGQICQNLSASRSQSAIRAAAKREPVSCA